MVGPRVPFAPTTFNFPTPCFLGDSTLAAITAVVVANVVLVAYIISSMREDQAEREVTKPSESRKDR
jgi:hypothetical protein